MRNLSSVKRPEMDGAVAPLPEVEEPGQSGERRFGDRALNVEEENRFGGGHPPFS